jgi:hypothetical protein
MKHFCFHKHKLLCGLFIIIFLPAFASKVPLNKGPYAARSVYSTLVNNTGATLILNSGSTTLAHGIWTTYPPSVVYPYTTVNWRSESNGTATGTAGTARYGVYYNNQLVNGDYVMNWNNPYIGSNSYSEGWPGGFRSSHSGGSGNDASITYTFGLSGTAIAYLPPFTLPHEQVTSISVRVKTGDVNLAGTDNNVYFSVGPMGWQLLKSGNQFERNADETYPLAINTSDFYADQIVYMRLEKKGNSDWHGASDFPDGEWYPDFVTMTINNKYTITKYIRRWISSPQDPIWEEVVQPSKVTSPTNKFLNTLKITPNDPAVKGITTACFNTNNGKRKGISGWLPTGLPNICATGIVVQRPPLSSDALATIDIRLESVTINGQTISYPISTPRYIRIEYPVVPIPGCFCEFCSLAGINFERDLMIAYGTLPDAGRRVTFCGAVKWDTDEAGHYEIHPQPGSMQLMRFAAPPSVDSVLITLNKMPVSK